MTDYVIGKRGEIPEGKGVAVEAGRRVVSVYRFGEEFFAIANACPHKGASMCEGEVLTDRRMVR
jgi:nitrite reductase/ring-hydroxylating ferredoxin subunit